MEVSPALLSEGSRTFQEFGACSIYKLRWGEPGDEAGYSIGCTLCCYDLSLHGDLRRHSLIPVSRLKTCTRGKQVYIIILSVHVGYSGPVWHAYAIQYSHPPFAF